MKLKSSMKSIKVFLFKLNPFLANFVLDCVCLLTLSLNREDDGQCEGRMVSLVGKVSVCCVGGSDSIPGRTNTQGLKIIEEKVLPLL